jgi:hypothetical protein
VAQAEHGVERAEDAAEAGVGGEQGLEGGVFHEVLEFEAGVGAGDDGCRFRRNPPGHSDLIPPTIPT